MLISSYSFHLVELLKHVVSIVTKDKAKAYYVSTGSFNIFCFRTLFTCGHKLNNTTGKSANQVVALFVAPCTPNPCPILFVAPCTPNHCPILFGAPCTPNPCPILFGAPCTPNHCPILFGVLGPRTPVPSSLGLLAPRTPALTRRWGSPENFCSSCMLQVEQIVAGSTFFLIFLTLTIAMLIVEGWSLPHALWFSLISVTTIGFGGQSKEFLLCVLLSSLGIWHCFSTVVPSALGAGKKAAVLEKRG